MKLTCIAVDDEPLALEIITDYISKIPYLELKESFDNAFSVLEYLKKESIDLLFLDIHMESFSGIQLVKALSHKPEVIFTTAFGHHAVEGFELEAADYLMKPISFERFVKAVDRVYHRRYHVQDAPAPSSEPIVSPSSDFIFIKTENRLQKILLQDILYVEGQGDYLRIFTHHQKIMTLQNFKTLENSLPQQNFCRVHKSYLVALDKIDHISRNRIFIGEKTIPVGDSYKTQLYEKINIQGSNK